jgi:hypothetical protein
VKSWLPWMRAAMKDGRAKPGVSLGALTGQDKRALDAVAALWTLYAACDEEGEAAALAAIRALLPAIQPQCRAFARELIPFALDWSDRERLWARVDRARLPDPDPPR